MTRQTALGVLAAVWTCLLVLLLFEAQPGSGASPGVRYVSTDGVDAGNCSSISGRCRTVQYAINQAAWLDEVHISGGVYTRAGTVARIISSVTLVGGYDPGFSHVSPADHPTILDAQSGGSVIGVDGPAEVMLAYLTLQHGDGTGACYGADYGCGGGIRAHGPDLDLAVQACVVTANVASRTRFGLGGGIYMRDGNLDLVYGRVLSNTASAATVGSAGYGYGGGVYLENGSVWLDGSEIRANLGAVAVEGHGGGVALLRVTTAEIHDSTIRANRATAAA